MINKCCSKIFITCTYGHSFTFQFYRVISATNSTRSLVLLMSFISYRAMFWFIIANELPLNLCCYSLVKSLSTIYQTNATVFQSIACAIDGFTTATTNKSLLSHKTNDSKKGHSKFFFRCCCGNHRFQAFMIHFSKQSTLKIIYIKWETTKLIIKIWQEDSWPFSKLKS